MTDILVIGAGSAGCAVAARLAERGARVRLIEAGPRDRRLGIRIPAAFSSLFRTEIDWAFDTEPQPELAGRRMFWPRGRVVGGSSAINAMIWTLGHPADYDGWAAGGNPGWSWRDVEPLFARIPIARTRPVPDNPVTRAFLDALRAHGCDAVPAADSRAPGGAGPFEVCVAGGERQSAAAGYLRPLPRGMELVTEALVERVVFQGTRAVGVEVVRGGRREVVRADQTVLAAGAIGSPWLLLRSGVGQPDDLTRAGVRVVHELPGVGRNLQDHLSGGSVYACRQPVTLERARSLGSLIRWLVARRGPLVSNVAEAGMFENTAGGSVPDLEFLVGPVYFRNHGFDPPPGPAFTLGTVLLQPRSRGRIALRPGSPEGPPVIDPGYCTAPGDLDLLCQGVARTRALAADPAFDELRGSELHPGPDYADDGGLERFVREHAQTLYHPVGTCRMGSGPDAVVGPDLLVHGTEGLRVADASIMPGIVSAHTHAPSVMIGEKAADLISPA